MKISKYLSVVMPGLLFVPALAWSQADAPASLSVAPAGVFNCRSAGPGQRSSEKKLDERKATIEDLTMKVAQLEKDSFDLVSGDFQPWPKNAGEAFDEEKSKDEDRIKELQQKSADLSKASNKPD